MKLAQFVVLFTSSFLVLYGLACACVPVELFRWVTDGELSGNSGIVDFRATYGGMTIAVGTFIYYLAHRGQVRISLQLVIVVLLCMAATRTLGFLLDGPANPLMYVYLGLEIGGAGLAAIASRSISSADHAVTE